MVCLYDRYGRVIPQATFEAAQRSRRLRNWTPPSSHINTLLESGLPYLRNRSRQMVRDNPIASNAAESFVSNLIGTGAKPSITLKKKRKLREAVLELWDDWTNECDADWRTGFYGLQAVIARALFESGEVFVRFRERRIQDGLSVPLQLQLMESEQLPMDGPRTAKNGNPIRCGIEFDGIGRRVAYHFYKVHPGDGTAIDDRGARVRVPASEVLHVYPLLRPGQLRGQPKTISSIVKLFLLDQYDDAELARKKVAALFAGFIKTPESDEKILGESAVDDVADLEPALMQKLLPGEDITFSEPSEVGGTYEDFQYRNLLAISCGLGMPYTNVTGDLRQVNYSSIRTGLIEFQRRMRQTLFNVIVYQFCRPVWRRWAADAYWSGALQKGDPALVARKVKWIPPRWEWVDPLKEIQAIRTAIRAGINSRDYAIEQQGLEPTEVDESQAAGNQRADELGLAFDSDPRWELGADVDEDESERAVNPEGADESEETSEEEGDDEREA